MSFYSNSKNILFKSNILQNNDGTSFKIKYICISLFYWHLRLEKIYFQEERLKGKYFDLDVIHSYKFYSF